MIYMGGKMNFSIREANVHDGEAIFKLNSTALGYDYPMGETTERLKTILCTEGSQVFVAIADGLVVGYIHAAVYDLLYAPTMTNIMGLAVSPGYRCQGIGKALVQEAEKWAKCTGSYAIRLNSGAARKEAHSFYRSCGFDSEKEQLRFIKEL